jgi:hypothetical protein
MWTGLKERKRRKKMAGTRNMNLNLPHREEIDKEVRPILALWKLFTKH